jgi:hypothetical protein
MAGIPGGGSSGTRSELSRSAHHQPAPLAVPRPPSRLQRASSRSHATWFVPVVVFLKKNVSLGSRSCARRALRR